MFAGIMKRFAKDEDGAVTVDYVVLTAAVVALALGLGVTLKNGVNTAAEGITADLTGEEAPANPDPDAE